MWDFTHAPRQGVLATRYDVAVTTPAQCAARLHAGEADLGLIPIAELTPALAVVPGCTVASLAQVRSIQLIARVPLAQVRTVAADSASRSSAAYARVLFRHFLGTDPAFVTAPADPVAMLKEADAALIIGDPALLALERRAEIEAVAGPLAWHDLAEEWIGRTRLPWVAAVWAVRPQALGAAAARAQLIDDLNRSRQNGQEHIEDLVREWTPRIALAPATIRHYLTRNIHYELDGACMRAIENFRTLAMRKPACCRRWVN